MTDAPLVAAVSGALLIISSGVSVALTHQFTLREQRARWMRDEQQSADRKAAERRQEQIAVAALLLATAEKTFRSLDELLHTSSDDERAPMTDHVKQLTDTFQETLEMVRLTASAPTTHAAEALANQLGASIRICNERAGHAGTSDDEFREAHKQLVTARRAFIETVRAELA